MAKKILIVDDDPAIVKYLESIFQDNGYETHSASDGKIAEKVVQDIKPDLITLDLQMPDEWGPRFYRKLTKMKDVKDTPVIVISGLQSSKYSLPKAVAYLSKPFDRDQLLAEVKKVFGE